MLIFALSFREKEPPNALLINALRNNQRHSSDPKA